MKEEYTTFELKKKGGGTRTICNPNRLLKAHLRHDMKRHYKKFNDLAIEAGVLDRFHGFVKKRNAVTAATKHIGFKTTIMMDISDFFGSCTKRHLEYHDIPQRSFVNDVLPQGFPTSPILANIAAIHAVKGIKQLLDGAFLRNEFTIYADDIAVSIDSEDYKDSAEVIRIVTTIMEANGFQINKKKTRIKYAKYGYRRILGINVGDDHLEPTKKIKRKIRAARHQDNKSSLGGLRNWAACHLPK